MGGRAGLGSGYGGAQPSISPGTCGHVCASPAPRAVTGVDGYCTCVSPRSSKMSSKLPVLAVPELGHAASFMRG